MLGASLYNPRMSTYYIHMFEDMNIYEYGENNAYIELAASVFSLLSDPTRLRIILLLKNGEFPVGEIAHRLGKRQAVISQHLAKMRLGKLVLARQEGTYVYYRLSDEHVSALVDQAIYQSEHIVDVVPAHHSIESSHLQGVGNTQYVSVSSGDANQPASATVPVNEELSHE
ncbi:ArsR/SmtB family transcription factor [Bifidobacterium sp.]|uniref:ArsR/SmtB family transcription factor n=1 Tax=Bifidobacterium sp. TaxID=41200 RepID=UPI0025BAFB43|nr:metalloregulator ArsR/SmtB family transcription factor [Bifidobacterium sp.]MCI1636250.1 metalloregulator ArsR/SmtB family transcription factor [Bifidobacterium sp.]